MTERVPGGKAKRDYQEEYSRSKDRVICARSHCGSHRLPVNANLRRFARKTDRLVGSPASAS
jgi:hypothetical protein